MTSVELICASRKLWGRLDSVMRIPVATYQRWMRCRFCLRSGKPLKLSMSIWIRPICNSLHTYNNTHMPCCVRACDCHEASWNVLGHKYSTCLVRQSNAVRGTLTKPSWTVDVGTVFRRDAARSCQIHLAHAAECEQRHLSEVDLHESQKLMQSALQPPVHHAWGATSSCSVALELVRVHG